MSLVDDEPDALELTSALLRLSGAEVIAVASETEALRAVEHASPEIVVSDIGMPGKDGYSLTRSEEKWRNRL